MIELNDQIKELELLKQKLVREEEDRKRIAEEKALKLYWIKHHRKELYELSNVDDEVLYFTNLQDQLSGNNMYDNFYQGNCEQHCEGWNGKDSRCSCGCRRLDWKMQDGELIPHIY